MNFGDLNGTHHRRTFLQRFAGGLGTVGLWHLLSMDGFADSPDSSSRWNPLEPKKPHFAPKAKNVIFLFIEGGPSQLDLFDPKPEMKKWDGKPLPESMTRNLQLAFIKPTAQVWASPRTFTRTGHSGMSITGTILSSRGDHTVPHDPAPNVQTPRDVPT